MELNISKDPNDQINVWIQLVKSYTDSLTNDVLDDNLINMDDVDRTIEGFDISFTDETTNNYTDYQTVLIVEELSKTNSNSFVCTMLEGIKDKEYIWFVDPTSEMDNIFLNNLDKCCNSTIGIDESICFLEAIQDNPTEQYIFINDITAFLGMIDRFNKALERLISMKSVHVFATLYKPEYLCMELVKLFDVRVIFKLYNTIASKMLISTGEALSLQDKEFLISTDFGLTAQKVEPLLDV